MSNTVIPDKVAQSCVVQTFGLWEAANQKKAYLKEEGLEAGGAEIIIIIFFFKIWDCTKPQHDINKDYL